MENNISTKKTIIGLLITFIGTVILQLISSFVLFLPLSENIQALLMGSIYAGLVIFFLKILMKYFFRTNWSTFRISLSGFSPFFLAISILAVAVIFISFFILVPGRLVYNNLDFIQLFWTILRSCFVIGLAAAVVEEFAYRGVWLTLIKKKLGTLSAVCLPALFWTFLHLLGSDFSDITGSIIRIISVSYTGIVLSLVTIATNSVWNAVYFHWLWNFTSSGIINIGTNINESVPINYILETDNIFLTGGSFGIDGSIISLAGYTLLLATSVFYIKKYGVQFITPKNEHNKNI